MEVRRIILAAAAVVAVSLIIVLGGTRDASLPPPAKSVAEPPQPERAPSITPKETVAAREAPAGAWRLDEAPARVAERWREERDKRAFFDRALAIGGGAYLHFAGKALAACGAVNRHGVIGAEQSFATTHAMNDPLFSRRLEAFRAHVKGCDRFEDRPVSDAEEAALLRRLVESPDLVGRIYANKLWALTAETNAAARESAREAIASGDPELLGLVHPALAAWHFKSLGRDAREAIGEDMRDELNAWRWALCDLGEDCSTASRFGRELCVGGGPCEWQSVDEIAAAYFPGASAARKNEIVAAVRARDWTKLGL